MPWSIAAPVIGAVASSALSSGGGSSGGGAGSGTQSKEPWAPIQPWIMNNAISGMNLQNAYTAQPFSNLQNQAYANQNNQSAYMRAAVPSLLGQISGQQVGFDRSNPNARPNAFSFDGLLAAGREGQQAQSRANQQGGLLGLLAPAPSSGNFNASANTPQVATPQAEEGKFMQQNGIVSGMNMSSFDGQNMYGSGGYGSFKYGMPPPKPGTKEYRDMTEYFNYGGSDPNNYYGRASTNPYVDPNANPLAYMYTSGGLLGGAPGEAEGPSAGAPGGGASAGPGGTF